MAADDANQSFRNFWEAPHRPLFSAAILCAFFSVAWWPLGVGLGAPPPALEPVIIWHIHELIFGFAAAAIGGYLLTALPSWTGNPPVRGRILMLLLAFWTSARLAIAFAIHLPKLLLVGLNCGYFMVLAGIIGHQLISARAYRKLGFLLAVIALGSGEVLFLTSALIDRLWNSLEIAQISLFGIAMLMVAVGVRAIPAFTNNWLAQTGRSVQTYRHAPVSLLLAQTSLALSIAAKLFARHDISYGAMICAALVLLWEMLGWRSLTAFSNPLLAALHISFLWLPLGFLTIGISGLAPTVMPMADAIHAVTIGAMSGLIMAISGRAAAHTKTGDMQANMSLKLGFLLIWAATCIRLAAPILTGLPVVMLAAVTWCLAWIAFAVGFLPALTEPLRRPVLSGRRHEAYSESPKAERMKQ